MDTFLIILVIVFAIFGGSSVYYLYTINQFMDGVVELSTFGKICLLPITGVVTVVNFLAKKTIL
jgi:hypothetical protein